MKNRHYIACDNRASARGGKPPHPTYMIRMKISISPLGANDSISLLQDPVLDHPGISALAPKIASILAQWANIEKILDALFAFSVRGDASKLETFRGIRGYDARCSAIADAAAEGLDAGAARRVKATLREAALVAEKRNELAHGIWASSPQHPDALVLLPHDFYIRFADLVLTTEAGAAVDNSDLLTASRLVRDDELSAALGEVRKAHDLIWSLKISIMPPERDVAGDGFATLASAVEAHPGVADRVANMMREDGRIARQRDRGPRD